MISLLTISDNLYLIFLAFILFVLVAFIVILISFILYMLGFGLSCLYQLLIEEDDG